MSHPESKPLKESFVWQIGAFLSRTEPFSTNVQCSMYNDQVKWKLQIYPNGSNQQNAHISVFLTHGGSDFNNVTIKYYGQIVDEAGNSKHWQHYELKNFSEVNLGFGWIQFVRKDLLQSIISSTNGSMILKLDLEYLEFNYEVKAVKVEKLLSTLPYDTYNTVDESVGLLMKSYENMIDGYLTDFTFEFENGQTINVHKAILAPKWKYFNSLLKSNMKEAQESKLFIADHEYAMIKNLLIFLYSNTIKFDTFDELLDLFKVAQAYEVIELINACLVLVKRNLTLQQVISTIFVAYQYDSIELKEMAFDVIMSSVNTIPKRITKFEDIPGHEQLNCKIHGQIIFELLGKFIEKSGV